MKKFFGRYGYPDLFFFPKNETPFLVFVILSFVASMLVVQVPGIAMWLGFLFAAYAAIANDSIQTIGTFIASNQDKKWWVLWIFLRDERLNVLTMILVFRLVPSLEPVLKILLG